MSDRVVTEELRKYRALATSLVATLIVSVVLFVQFIGIDRARAEDAFRWKTENAAAVSGTRLSLLIERLKAIGREHLMLQVDGSQLAELVHGLGIDAEHLSLCAYTGGAANNLMPGVTDRLAAQDPCVIDAPPVRKITSGNDRYLQATGLETHISTPEDGSLLLIRLFGTHARELRVKIASQALLDMLADDNAGLDPEHATACLSLRIGQDYRQLGCTVSAAMQGLSVGSMPGPLPGSLRGIGTMNGRPGDMTGGATAGVAQGATDGIAAGVTQDIRVADLHWRMTAIPDLSSFTGSISLLPLVMFGAALTIGGAACVFAYRAADKNIQLEAYGEELRGRLDQLQQMETQNGLLDQFAAMAAHDLQAPLRFIVSKAHLLACELEELKQAELLQMARTQVEQGERMHALILDLLAFCRAGQASLTIEPVDVRAVVEQEVTLLSAHEEYAATRIHVGNLPVSMSCDAEKLGHIVRNLLGNAAKFSKDGDEPEITISAGRDQRHGPWTFRVRDNGPGISPGQHEVIFRPFARLDSRTEGTGMGLAIVKIMIEQHGGTIWIDSRSGPGTTFCFTMPGATPASTPS